MILTEFREEELKEEEEKIKREFKFISSKLSSLLFYLLLFILMLIYLYLLSEKSKLERQYSKQREILKLIENEISIYNDLLTTQISVDSIKKKLGLKDLFLPKEIWYIYSSNDNIMIPIKVGGN